MKVYEIAPGVKLVLEEDCPDCKDRQRDIESYACQLTMYREIVQDILKRTPKEVKYKWDEGYNQCMKDTRKIIDDRLGDGL